MQYQLKVRETLTGAVTVYTSPIDVTNMPLLVLTMAGFVASGTTPQLLCQLQTSPDLETWTDVGSSFNITAAMTQLAAFAAQSQPYTRYVRCELVVSGTDPLFNFSLYLDTFPST